MEPLWPALCLLALAALAVAGAGYLLQRRKLLHIEAVLFAERQCHANAARIMDNCDDVVWLLDTESQQLIYLTPSVERKYGWKVEELTGKSALEILPLADQKKLRELLEELKKPYVAGQAEGPPAARIEIEVPLKQGGTLPVETEYKLLNDDNGKPTLLLGVSRDISERRRLEQGLRAAEERARLALYCSEEGIWDFNLQTKTISYVDGWEDLSRYDASAMDTPSKDYRNLIHADDTPKLRAELDRHINGEAPNFHCEFRIRTKDGGWRWVLSRGKLWSSAADGQPLRIIGTHTDITSRKVAEVAMSRANVRLHSQIDEIRALQIRLTELAVRDPLTDLYNRRYLDETLEREVARARREGLPLSLVMLDVDNFKILNDSYGHQAGDEVLKTLSKLLREDTRAEDVVCRYGGEEFLILLPNMPIENACERAEHWRCQLEKYAFVFGNDPLSVTASFGVSGYPHHGQMPDELTRAADNALYGAKRNGRNRVEVFEEEPMIFVTGSPPKAAEVKPC